MKKLLLILAIYCTTSLPAYAAEVSIIAPASIDTGERFTINVDLNTDGLAINSVDVSLLYPKEILSFKGYKEDGAVKKLWLVSPKDTDGVIHFSGIIPGGVEGVYNPDKSGLQPIPLAQLIFTPKKNGVGEFIITHSDILQNDGVGTPLLHGDKNASITVSLDPTKVPKKDESNSDTVPPEPFTIEYILAGFFSKTPSMVSFFTTDIGSGVEKYQIQNASHAWKAIVSPHALPKGILSREVTIRAIDFSGNIRESKVTIPGLLSGLQLLSIFIVAMTCYFLFFVVKRKR